MDGSPTGFSVHGILQTRILEWVDTFSKGSSNPGVLHWRLIPHHLSHQGIPVLNNQFSKAQSCPTVCDSMDYSTPGLPVHHQLLEFTQPHVHWVCEATGLTLSLFSLWLYVREEEKGKRSRMSRDCAEVFIDENDTLSEICVNLPRCCC